MISWPRILWSRTEDLFKADEEMTIIRILTPYKIGTVIAFSCSEEACISLWRKVYELVYYRSNVRFAYPCHFL